MGEKEKKKDNYLGFPSLGVMPTPNLNFTIILNAITIILLNSTPPIHFITKILQSPPLFPNPIGLENPLHINFLKSNFSELITLTKMFMKSQIHLDG
jgi:hypothetical protein